jgi:two-component SAPR family response regulator
MLSLTLFGSVSATLHYCGESQALTLTTRPSELLAFLAFGRGRFYPRSVIARALCGSLEVNSSAGSVNTALWRLRHVLERAPLHPGDFIVTNRQGAIGLNGPVPVGLDVADFEALTKPCLSKSVEDMAAADADALQRAIALFKGEPLAGFESPWALRERERLRNVYLDTAARLMHFEARLGRYEQAIEYGRRVLTLDELREDIHRDVMRLFVLNGQRPLALKQFESFRTALHRELGISPMHETHMLYRRIAIASSAESVVTADSMGAVPEHERPRSAGPTSRASGFTTGATSDCATPTDQVRAARALLAEADRQLKLSLRE